jgi:anti-sigma regulatory factor (Ser/Thr protein kinase)
LKPPASKHLPCATTSPAAARAFVRNQLQTWKLVRLGDVVELLTSEVVTNAIRHGRSAIDLRVQSSASAIRVEVDDTSDAPLVVQPQGIPTGHIPTDHGLGLQLITMLAADWGVCHHEHGKTVWFELRR